MSTQRWYVRRGTQVRGPFPARLLQHFQARGKLTDGDEVSADLNHWQPLAGLRVAPAAPAAVERPAGRDTRANRERPASPPAPLAPRSAYVERLLHPRENRLVQGGVVALMLAAIVFAGVGLGGGDDRPGADCGAAPGAGVNWSSCGKDAFNLSGADLDGAILSAVRMRGADLKGARLGGADLSYAELGGSTLAYAQLAGANLKGATLKGADLSYADLAGADLSYADLSGARLGGARLEQVVLDNAIWTDGSVCGAGSIGDCR